MKVNYVCLLANADRNLREIELRHGFKVESLSWNYVLDLVDIIESKIQSLLRIGTMLRNQASDFEDDQGKIIVVLNEFEVDLKFDEDGNLLEVPEDLEEIQRELENGYLSEQLVKMRLYQEGCIAVASSFYYTKERDIPRLVLASRRIDRIPTTGKYEVSENEIDELQAFIDELELPFEFPYLQLAHESYEHSYQITSTSLTFLVLMMGMEALFSRGSVETSYSVSRNAAVFLGTPGDESEMIFENLKELFRKRSRLLHGRQESKKKSKRIDEDGVIYLRSLLRRGIIRAHNLGVDKDKLLSLLNKSKF